MHDLLLRNAFMCILLPILYASCQQTAKSKIRREKMHQLERLKTGMKKMDQAPYKIGSFEAICISQVFLHAKTGSKASLLCCPFLKTNKASAAAP